MTFRWSMELDSGEEAAWEIEIDKRKHWGVVSERASVDEQPFLERESTEIHVFNEESADWEHEQKVLPSYLSTLFEESEVAYPSLCAIRRCLEGLYIPFLNPVVLRQRSRSEFLGPQGENFARYLFEFRRNRPTEFGRALAAVKSIFPQVEDVKSVRSRYGWTEIQITQRQRRGRGNVFKAEQVNDGLLRILALATAPFAVDDLQLLVVEEPENGMHPRLLEATIDLLRSLPVQVLVTTHSPVLLNYAKPEEVAVMRWPRNAPGPQVAPFQRLSEGMKRLGYYDIGDLLFSIDDERLFRGYRAQ
jgi:hypothetical protein